MNIKDIRKTFEEATGIKTVNSQGEPDIEYVTWLEDRLLAAKKSGKLMAGDLGQLLGERCECIPLEEVEKEKKRTISYLLKIRDALVKEDYDLAYHLLYKLCNPDYPLEPWVEMEQYLKE